jgi:hypothetical protein
MNPMPSRRRFLALAGAGAAATAAISGLEARGQDEPGTIKIIAVACSPRKGKTTATALQVCLAAAKEVAPERIETELIELAGLSIPWEPAVGMPLAHRSRRRFPGDRGEIGRSCRAGHHRRFAGVLCRHDGAVQSVSGSLWRVPPPELRPLGKGGRRAGRRRGSQWWSGADDSVGTGCLDVPGDGDCGRGPADEPLRRPVVEPER